eukprot:CAMPEP_0194032634 /NCGR_PEP_ID=MMETSP0009_2-20130614/5532_1 /TAXON_ID=210454 /ORGANISM="Grammatophora oceanica, Strain CCMP 410" /LENGTH=64 /DNA_ID=CAMNT_0038673133 /DNA_START=147 /DNA_END=341 /DNA_ORIENTATION=+
MTARIPSDSRLSKIQKCASSVMTPPLPTNVIPVDALPSVLVVLGNWLLVVNAKFVDNSMLDCGD